MPPINIDKLFAGLSSQDIESELKKENIIIKEESPIDIDIIGKLFEDSPRDVRGGLRKYNILVREREEQKRRNLYHYVVHFLAIFIIVAYIFFIIWSVKVPEEFPTIVSVIIGFYFAKSLSSFK